MIPFRNSLPYDIVMNDVYVQECPFCKSTHVLLPLKPAEVKSIYGGARKRTVILPCCHSPLKLIDADHDYLLSNRPLREL